MNQSAARAYSGLKVLDLSQGIAGPYCAQILLQNGADVTKVEPPSGDWGRAIGFGPDGMSAIAIAYNLGKRSICVDGAIESGRVLLRRLAAAADVIVESFRPGVMQRLGLSYEELAREKPDLVYVSVSAFGPDGPYADRPGSDSTLQALSGLMVANRDESGKPRKIGIWLVDVATGIYAAQATGAALYRRATQHRGEHVQVSLLGAAAAIQGNAIVDAALGDGQPARPASVPAGTFETADGHINVTSLHDRMFAGLCRAIGQDTWLRNPHFATAEARFGHIAEINEALIQIFRSNTTSHWMELLRANSVVCGPVCGYREFLADVQVRHERIFQEIAQLGLKPVAVPRVPGTQRSVALEPAPRAGEHTIEVLTDLGLSAAEIESLFQSGAIAPSIRKAQ